MAPSPSNGSNSDGYYHKTIFDGRQSSRDQLSRPAPGVSSYVPPEPVNERDFMLKVQQELEEQRTSWKSEVDRLTRGASSVQLGDEVDAGRRQGGGRTSTNAPGGGSSSTSGYSAETNSYVDVSDGRRAVFKAFVDVSEYSPSDISVSVDKLTNRVVVEAAAGDESVASRTFTQRIQLPQFADDANMSARMNQHGILKVTTYSYLPFTIYSRTVDNRTAHS